MKITFILGTRPEIIKLFPLITKAKEDNHEVIVIHTNQHYDKNMDEVFFDELGIDMPNYNLRCNSGTHGEQTAKMLSKIETVLIDGKPDIVIVQGDTNTVLAGALAASKLNIKVAHVEAGLRSYDRTMPEEVNRIVTDHISDYLFCPTGRQSDILLDEGIDENKIFITGNTIVDSVNLIIKTFANKESKLFSDLNISNDNYFLLTCHRPSNTDSDDNFNTILKSVDDIAKRNQKKCVFPVHPRLNNKIPVIEQYTNIIPIKPVGYTDLVKLQNGSSMIFTDSGGIQEEACILEKSAVILRTNTERPEAVDVGGAVLLNDMSEKDINEAYDELINKEVNWWNPFGNGNTSATILQIINSEAQGL
jgi:UDP-N-acetylglucosamine 2-epimerase (non-hydrolysing)